MRAVTHAIERALFRIQCLVAAEYAQTGCAAAWFGAELRRAFDLPDQRVRLIAAVRLAAFVDGNQEQCGDRPIDADGKAEIIRAVGAERTIAWPDSIDLSGICGLR